jgi:glycosyltransferase involved in cell wall biosynthesis
MKIVVVHEVNYLEKIIYEYQILPEILSMLGHDITIVDYDETWRDGSAKHRTIDLRTKIYADTHRAYPAASVTVRRPGMVRLPVLARISGAITNGLEVRRVLAEKKPDVILLYGLPTVGLQSVMNGRLYDVPVVFRSIDVLNQLAPRSLAGITKLLERIVYRSVAGIVALTPRLQQHVASYGVPDERIRLLPCGVDTSMFSPGSRSTSLLSRWNIGGTDPVILFMGTIYRFSGLDRVIADFPRVLKRHPQTKLLVVGWGEDEERLKRLAIERQVSANVIFTGLQPYSLLPDIIRASDICINPFELNAITRDILPNKVFQYLACGKPLVATRLPGTEPFLPGEDEGVVYTPQDEVVDRLLELIDDPNRRRRLGENAAAAVQQKYDWKKIAQQMVDMIHEFTSV